MAVTAIYNNNTGEVGVTVTGLPGASQIWLYLYQGHTRDTIDTADIFYRETHTGSTFGDTFQLHDPDEVVRSGEGVIFAEWCYVSDQSTIYSAGSGKYDIDPPDDNTGSSGGGNTGGDNEEEENYFSKRKVVSSNITSSKSSSITTPAYSIDYIRVKVSQASQIDVRVEGSEDICLYYKLGTTSSDCNAKISNNTTPVLNWSKKIDKTSRGAETTSFTMMDGDSYAYAEIGWYEYDGYEMDVNYEITITPLVTNYTITYALGTANKWSDGTTENKTQTKPSTSNISLYGAIGVKNSVITTDINTYTFNGNGATTQNKYEETSNQRTAYTHTSWNTSSGGGGTTYALGETYSTNSSKTLYPIFTSSVSYTQVYFPTANECQRTNYTLLGWSSSSTATSADFLPGDALKGNHTTKTWYAVWKQDKYIIQFATGQGTTIASQEVEIGASIILPTSTAPYQKQIGWFDGDATYLPGETYTPKKSVVLTAQWENCWGELMQLESYGLGDIASISQIYSIPRFVPAKILFVPACAGCLDIETINTSNTPDWYSYFNQHDNEYPFTRGTGTARTAAYTIPAKASYSISDDIDATNNNVSFSQIVTANIHYGWYLNADFDTSNTYELSTLINFYPQHYIKYWDGDTIINSFAWYYQGMPANHPKNPSIMSTIPEKTGYTFKGWSTTKGSSTAQYQPNQKYQIKEKITDLYAVWEIIDYKINYQINEGLITGSYPLHYTFITDTITLPIPTKSSYGFIGWYNNADFTGEKITTIPKGSQGDITLYAYWKPYVFFNWTDPNYKSHKVQQYLIRYKDYPNEIRGSLINYYVSQSQMQEFINLINKYCKTSLTLNEKQTLEDYNNIVDALNNSPEPEHMSGGSIKPSLSKKTVDDFISADDFIALEMAFSDRYFV